MDFDPRSWFESLPSNEQAAIVASANVTADNVENLVAEVTAEPNHTAWNGIWPAV